MSNTVVGIDPGLTGAVSVFTPDDALFTVIDMPVAGKEVSGVLLARFLAEFGIDVAVVEKVGSMPGQGLSSTFRFGVGYGTVLGVLAALNIRVEHVTPGKWKAGMGLLKHKDEKNSAHKERSRLRALELWPGDSGLFARKKDSGRAEAALIGHWWFTKMNGAG